MLCYKDRTLCDFEDCSKFKICTSALKNQDILNAKELGLLIALYSDKPVCYKDK